MCTFTCVCPHELICHIQDVHCVQVPTEAGGVNCLIEVLGAEPRSSLCKSSMWFYLLSHFSNL